MILIWLFYQRRLDNRLTIVLCFLVAFGAGGFVDIFGLAQTLILSVIFLAYRQHAKRSHILVALLGSVIATIIVVIAPGNFIRSGMLAPQHDLKLAIGGTLFLMPGPLLASTYLAPFSMLALAVLPALFAYYVDRRPFPHVGRYLRLIPLFTFALVAVCFGPGFYFSGSRLPGRAWLLPEFFTFCGVVAWSYLFGLVRFQRRRSTRTELPRWLPYLVSIILLAALYGSFSHAFRLVQSSEEYASQWDQRDATVRASLSNFRGSTFKISSMLYTYELEDITDNPDWWVNVCAATYYDVPNIVSDTPASGTITINMRQ